MRKKSWISLLMLVLLAITFYIGYTVGIKQNSDNTIQSKWIKDGKPPLPEIDIDGVAIKVVQGSYTWCSSSLGNESSCESVDMSLSEIPSTLVPAGAQINIKAPKRIKEFSLINTNQDLANDDPYFVPMDKGVYLYKIECDWFLDQGHSDYLFSVEVK